MSVMPKKSIGTRTILALCYLTLMVDGFDLVTNGLIAPRVAPEFGMGPADLGLLFGLTSFGMLIGAISGGMLGDRFGPKAGLLQALLVFGTASLLSALATNAPVLIATRVLTGIGIGAALPNVLSYVATLVAPERRAGVGTIMGSAVPIGGGVAGLLIFAFPSDLSWRAIVLLGGILPLALTLPLALMLPKARADVRARVEKLPLGNLFEAERRFLTPMLWLASFLTMSLFYALINWLPTFLGQMGLGKGQVGLMMLLFTYTGAISAIVFGIVLQTPGRTKKLAIAGFVGTGAGAIALHFAGPDFASIAAAALLTATFSSGAQCLLLGLSPTIYPLALRGRGAGAAIAAGRLGAIVGPMSAGFILAAGSTYGTVYLLMVPLAIAALFATLVVLDRSAIDKVAASIPATSHH
ncbi:MFS transporter [Sphingomonas sp. MG17]|uniref:MFS transporter n=1 Tax=Sphingomonas tagetis TaxID=2949092 RepID=A0A9X2HGD3_9SPHN|nr:MFS transporter [Sphingomonas tagetis]MCP3730298.1 MFS transporter [Sphingomonas tagetis]